MRKWKRLFAALLFGLVLGTAPAGETAKGSLVLEAGPIWDNDHARERCLEVLAEWLEENPGKEAVWTGEWNTTVPGEMSVCYCEAVAEETDAETGVLLFGNFTPAAMAGVAVNVDGTVSGTPEDVSILPGQIATVRVDTGQGVDAIVFDLILAKVRFHDLFDLPTGTDVTIKVTMEDEEDASLSWRDAQGKMRTVPGEVTLLPDDDEKEHGIEFDEVLAIDSISAIRKEYTRTMQRVGDRYGLWVDFAGDFWYAFLTPDDRDLPEDKAKPAAVHLVSPIHYVIMNDTLAKINDLGFRPLLAWGKMDLGETELIGAMAFDRFDVERLDGRDDEEVWEEVVREFAWDDKTEERPWIIQLLFVTKETHREIGERKEITPRPVFLFQRDNGVFLHLRYYSDGLPLIEQGKEAMSR